MSEKKNIRLCGPERVQRREVRERFSLQMLNQFPGYDPSMGHVFHLMFCKVDRSGQNRRDSTEDMEDVYEIILSSNRDRLRAHDVDFVTSILQSLGVKMLWYASSRGFWQNVWKWIDHAMTLM